MPKKEDNRPLFWRDLTCKKDLMIPASKKGRELLKLCRDKYNLGDNHLTPMVVSFIGLEMVNAASLAALTSSPIVGDPTLIDTYWWFPNYQVESEIDTLIEKGVVVFDKAE